MQEEKGKLVKPVPELSRRIRVIRGKGEVHRHTGEALLQRHVRAPGLCRGRPPGAGDPAGGRSAGSGATLSVRVKRRSRGARELGSKGGDERNIFEPVCFVEAGFAMLAVGKGSCQ